MADTEPALGVAAIDTTRLAVMLIAIDVLLVVGYLSATYLIWPGVPAYELLNLDGEASLAAWVSSSQLLLAAVAFAAAGRRERRSTKWVFWTTAAALLFLSADEAAAIHEKVTVIAKSVGVQMAVFDGHGAWIPLYVGAGLVFLTATRSVWMAIWHERRRSARLLLLGCGLFFSGAVILEILSYGALRNPGMRSLYGLQVAAEETLELVGVTLILVASVSLLTGKDH